MSDDPGELSDCAGPRLPEPLVAEPPPGSGGEEPAGRFGASPGRRTDSASMALLVVMETLPPLERAVFVLSEVFGYPHGEIAEILGRHPGTVRRLALRAREHVRARRPHYPADPRLRQQ
jgi:DNA-directed RNA polymerase specialized sigma24 family protein